MWPRTWPGRLLLASFAGLHLVALVSLWIGTDEHLAKGVALVSVLPVLMAGGYLVRRTFAVFTWLDLSVLCYALWSLLSVILYLQQGNPSGIRAYPYGLYHFLLPISFYFATRTMRREDAPRLIGGIVALNAFAIGYGIFLHFTRPPFYNDYLVRLLYSRGAVEEWQLFARLQSYVGSTTVGYLGPVTLVMVTLAAPSIRRYLPLLMVLFVAGTGLSLQRASLIGLVLALGYLLLGSKQRVATRVLLAALLVAGAAYGVWRIRSTIDPLTNRLSARVTTDLAEGFSDFGEERGYGPGLRYLRTFPLGVGLGGTASSAATAGYVSKGEVSDANFMRIAADLGLPGLSLFLLLLGFAGWRAWTSDHRMAWLTFLCIHCGIMLSTNVFDSFYVAQGFWLLLALLEGDRPAALAGAIVPPSSSISGPTPMAHALSGRSA
jgi:hypothetical protein